MTGVVGTGVVGTSARTVDTCVPAIQISARSAVAVFIGQERGRTVVTTTESYRRLDNRATPAAEQRWPRNNTTARLKVSGERPCVPPLH